MLWLALSVFAEVTLTGTIIPTVTTEGGSGGCYDVVERDGWVEVTAC